MSEARYAVLIGNSEFPQDPKLLQPLRCPPKDIAALNSTLKSPKHGRFSRTIVLENKASDEILREINEVLTDAQKGDLVLIYYSGHGKLNVLGALHLATIDTRLKILDTTAIPVRRIRDLMDASAANKFILILDCCYSGKVGDAFLKGGVEEQLQEVSGGNSGRGIYIMTASTGIQVAQEKERDEYSLLTKYLLDGIREGKADFDDDGSVTISDLFKYVSESMRQESFQVPMKWDLNVQGDSLVIARTGQAKGTRRGNEIEQLLYHRLRFRDRYIIAGLTVGGALGGGLGLFLMRLPISLLLFGSNDFIVTRLFTLFYSGAILGGALALGIALAAQLWKASEDPEKHSTPLRWARKSRSASNLALLLCTVTFAIAYLCLAVLGGIDLEMKRLIPSLAIGLALGFGLSLSLYGQPTAGTRLGWRGWTLRIGIAGIVFALVQLHSVVDRTATLPIVTWGTEFYARYLVTSDSRWMQEMSARPSLLSYVAEGDAFLVGIALAVGVTLGLTKAADSLARWVATVQPDRE